MLFKTVTNITEMEQEESIYQGILLLPPVGKILKKSWQQKYFMLFKASKFGKERLEVYDSQESKEPSKFISLENCIKVYSKSPTTFVVITRTNNAATNTHEFGTLTEYEMNEWLTAIQSVVFPDEVSKITSIEEDNDLYCSSGEGVFNVKLHPSTVSNRCGLENKNYTLVLTQTSLQLRNILDNKLLYNWPYCYIRRYGYKNGTFKFEAGRKCESGEGTFYLEHPNQQEIFRCLASKMKSMQKLLSGEASSPLLDVGDAQLHAALSMEARSRTPLPPSASQSIQSFSSMSDSTMSIKSSVESEHSKPFVLRKPEPKPKLVQKLKPTKPPRKFLPGNKATDSDASYEAVQKYDQIEHRVNAWQTHGIDAPDHTEHLNEEDEYMSWGGTKKEPETVKKPLAPAIITENTPADTGDTFYDKLNFFGSTSKLNVKSHYKEAFPSSFGPSVPEPPSFNDYDEVHFSDKSEEVGKKKDENVAHQFHNDEAYAVISKPKRV
ncbi:unnamed protein product [Phyllotreta striolata]|uniref:Insulin receptor substrate 1 n=1 Tax=Phyllotreta striolata TaxID=444603 RepID=A0A9N9TI96_PHYSR|nr:unnamed protein product [Phyllotreta striolata]